MNVDSTAAGKFSTISSQATTTTHQRSHEGNVHLAKRVTLSRDDHQNDSFESSSRQQRPDNFERERKRRRLSRTEESTSNVFWSDQSYKPTSLATMNLISTYCTPETLDMANTLLQGQYLKQFLFDRQKHELQATFILPTWTSDFRSFSTPQTATSSPSFFSSPSTFTTFPTLSLSPTSLASTPLPHDFSSTNLTEAPPREFPSPRLTNPNLNTTTIAATTAASTAASTTTNNTTTTTTCKHNVRIIFENSQHAYHPPKIMENYCTCNNVRKIKKNEQSFVFLWCEHVCATLLHISRDADKSFAFSENTSTSMSFSLPETIHIFSSFRQGSLATESVEQNESFTVSQLEQQDQEQQGAQEYYHHETGTHKSFTHSENNLIYGNDIVNEIQEPQTSSSLEDSIGINILPLKTSSTDAPSFVNVQYFESWLSRKLISKLKNTQQQQQQIKDSISECFEICRRLLIRGHDWYNTFKYVVSMGDAIFSRYSTTENSQALNRLKDVIKYFCISLAKFIIMDDDNHDEEINCGTFSSIDHQFRRECLRYVIWWRNEIRSVSHLLQVAIDAAVNSWDNEELIFILSSKKDCTILDSTVDGTKTPETIPYHDDEHLRDSGINEVVSIHEEHDVTLEYGTFGEIPSSDVDSLSHHQILHNEDSLEIVDDAFYEDPQLSELRLNYLLRRERYKEALNYSKFMGRHVLHIFLLIFQGDIKQGCDLAKFYLKDTQNAYSFFTFAMTYMEYKHLMSDSMSLFNLNMYARKQLLKESLKKIVQWETSIIESNNTPGYHPLKLNISQQDNIHVRLQPSKELNHVLLTCIHILNCSIKSGDYEMKHAFLRDLMGAVCSESLSPFAELLHKGLTPKEKVNLLGYEGINFELVMLLVIHELKSNDKNCGVMGFFRLKISNKQEPIDKNLIKLTYYLKTEGYPEICSPTKLETMLEIIECYGRINCIDEATDLIKYLFVEILRFLSIHSQPYLLVNLNVLKRLFKVVNLICRDSDCTLKMEMIEMLTIYYGFDGRNQIKLFNKNYTPTLRERNFGKIPELNFESKFEQNNVHFDMLLSFLKSYEHTSKCSTTCSLKFLGIMIIHLCAIRTRSYLSDRKCSELVSDDKIEMLIKTLLNEATIHEDQSLSSCDFKKSCIGSWIKTLSRCIGENIEIFSNFLKILMDVKSHHVGKYINELVNPFLQKETVTTQEFINFSQLFRDWENFPEAKAVLLKKIRKEPIAESDDIFWQMFNILYGQNNSIT